MTEKIFENVYIFYSAATDITGKKIAETLNCRHTSKKEEIKSPSLVIGWGPKTIADVSFGKDVPCLNHPDKVRQNRNKFNALMAMKNGGVSVAPFIDAKDASRIGKAGCDVCLPVIARRNFHQGGSGFWSCPTMAQVNSALKAESPAQYFQNMIEIAEEFRIHVAFGEVVYAAKKVQRTVDEMEKAYVEDELARQEELAKKNGDTIDEKTAILLIKRQAKKVAENGANQLARSNRLGWKFVHIKSVNKDMETQVTRAVKTLGLDFGAVDCCIDNSGKVFIIEVNTGPGLEGSTFEAYIKAFKKEVEKILKPKTTIEKIVGKIKGVSAPNLEAAVKEAPIKATKKNPVAGLTLLQRLKIKVAIAETADSEDMAQQAIALFEKSVGE